MLDRLGDFGFERDHPLPGGHTARQTRGLAGEQGNEIVILGLGRRPHRAGQRVVPQMAQRRGALCQLHRPVAHPAARKGPRQRGAVVVAIDNRCFSRRSHGFIVGHVPPEARTRRPIALIKDSDRISIETSKIELSMKALDSELAECDDRVGGDFRRGRTRDLRSTRAQSRCPAWLRMDQKYVGVMSHHLPRELGTNIFRSYSFQ